MEGDGGMEEGRRERKERRLGEQEIGWEGRRGR